MNQETRDKMAALVAGNKPAPAAPAAKKPEVIVIGGGVNAGKTAATAAALQKVTPPVIAIPATDPQKPAQVQRLNAIRGAVAEVQKEREEEQETAIKPEKPQPFTPENYSSTNSHTEKFTALVHKERNFTNMSQGTFEQLTIEDLKIRLEFWEAAARHFQALSKQAQEQYCTLVMGNKDN